jgi:Ca2+-binding RTX toxin-like protein
VNYYASSVSAGVSVVLSEGRGTGGDAQGDVLSGIENLIGTQYNDGLTGNASANVLEGNQGDDLLSGNGGNDTLIGGSGADRMQGGSGTDTVDYSDSSSYPGGDVGVTVVLFDNELGYGWGAGGIAAGDRLSDIENVIGTHYDDHLEGYVSANVLQGGLGNDFLSGGGGGDILLGGGDNDELDGGSGADILDGGSGSDTLTGGANADIFQWTAAGYAHADVVSDFDRSEGDLLDVSEIDANVAGSGNQSFSFIGTGPFTAAGQINWFTQGGNTYIALNIDADGSAEAIIEVAGQQTVDASWFVL